MLTPGLDFVIGVKTQPQPNLNMMTGKTILRALIGSWALITGSAALAQSGGGFDLTWSTIGGGGGTSLGGPYSLSGTIGQPDAGILRGGNYQLAGGFWSVIAPVQPPGTPLLRIDRSGSSIVVSWASTATGFLLDQATLLKSAATSWTQVPAPYQTNADSISIQLSAPVGSKFYRLRGP